MGAVNIPQSAGSKSFILWGKETTYNTGITPTKHFGLDTNFDANLKNNLKPNRGFRGSTGGGRDVFKFTAGMSELDFTIDFDLNDAEFLEMVLGNESSGTYSGTDFPPSMTVVHGIDNVATDRNEKYTGCVIDSCSIKGAEGEPITASLNIKASKLTYSSSLESNTALTDKAPYTFSESTFEVPSGTAITNIINDFEVSINNNWTLHYGTSRTATAVTPGEREYRIKLSTKYVTDDLLNKALGGSSNANTPTQNATFKIVLTRPDQDKLTFNFTLSPIDSYNLTSALNEPIGENIEIIASKLEIVKS